MIKTTRQSGTTHTHKVTMLSVYDDMQKMDIKDSFQANHRPYQFATVKKPKKGKFYV